MTPDLAPRPARVVMYETSAPRALLLVIDDAQAIVSSEYGTWSHYWPKRGRGGPLPLAEWLLDAGSDYLAIKFMGSAANVYDPDQTWRNVLDAVADGNDGLVHELADATWRNSEEIRADLSKLAAAGGGPVTLSYEFIDESEYDAWVWRTSLVDAWELRATKMSPDWTSFWSRCWPLLAEQIRSGQAWVRP